MKKSTVIFGGVLVVAFFISLAISKRGSSGGYDSGDKNIVFNSEGDDFVFVPEEYDGVYEDDEVSWEIDESVTPTPRVVTLTPTPEPTPMEEVEDLDNSEDSGGFTLFYYGAAVSSFLNGYETDAFTEEVLNMREEVLFDLGNPDLGTLMLNYTDSDLENLVIVVSFGEVVYSLQLEMNAVGLINNIKVLSSEVDI